jgi:hypothetical protein
MTRITFHYVQFIHRHLIKFDIYLFRDALISMTLYILYICITVYMAKCFVRFCLIL